MRILKKIVSIYNISTITTTLIITFSRIGLNFTEQFIAYKLFTN